MKERIEINTMIARNVYSTESLEFIKKILQKCCSYEIPEKAKEIHKQNKPFDYTDEFRIYGTKEQGIKYHSYYKLQEKGKSKPLIYSVSNEAFGFDQLWIKFTISSQDGLILEVETKDKKLLKDVINHFEQDFGYCRKQSEDEVFDELIHELRIKVTENEGEKGVKVGLKAIEIYPTDFWARFYLGCSYALIDQHKKAIKEFKHAIKADPTSADAYYNLGKSYLEINDLKKAEDAMHNAFELAKKIHTISYYLAIILEKKGEIEKAKEYYQKTIDTAPLTKNTSHIKNFIKEAEKRLKELKG
ncbi:MAG: tetratricopeptide repeat protein [Asgard group archaeon]|nr:tetratricopeptide repeat protein [Asgard group archaeon]